MARYKATVVTKEETFDLIGQVDHLEQIDSAIMSRVNKQFTITSLTFIPHALIIFDDDGTLTPKRVGSCGWFSRDLMPNVNEFVEELHEIGVRVGVASNQGPERQLSDIVDQMTWTREALHITPNLATFAQGGHRCKPAPNMLQELMLVAGVEPEQTLFVGDQDSDKEAAKAAGVEFIYAEEFFGW